MIERHKTRHLVIGKDSFTGSELVSGGARLVRVVGGMTHAGDEMEFMFTVKDLR